MGLGTGDLEKLVILSPSERVPKVRWKRSRITVRPAEGWRPNTVYRVQLLPGVMDIRRNRYDSTRVVTFTTGAPLPELHLTGQVWDWTTARPAAERARRRHPPSRQPAIPDARRQCREVRFRPAAERRLPRLRRHRPEQERPARSTGGVGLPADAEGQRRRAGALGLSARFRRPASLEGRGEGLALGDPHLHPTPRPRTAIRSGHGTRPPAPRLGRGRSPDAAVRESNTTRSTARRRPHPIRPCRRPPRHRPSRSARRRRTASRLPRTASSRRGRRSTPRCSLRVAEMWKPGATYVVEIDSIRNANGAAADVRGPLEVPEVKVDTTAVAIDTLGTPADSLRMPTDSAAVRPDPPPMPGNDSLPPTAAGPLMDDPRRQLPSVDRLLQEPGISRLLDTIPRSVVVAAAREAVAVARRGRSEVPEDWAADVMERASRLGRRSLLPVLNATGVVLHTNLGRAPLAEAAIEAVTAVASGYSALEFDLEAGVRGHRTDHGRRLLADLAGAADALVVNNAASALVVALNTVAAGMEVVISRGELVEIGGSFRIPDILARERRPAPRGRHHQPHAPRRLPARTRTGHGRHPQGPSVELRADRLRARARGGGPGPPGARARRCRMLHDIGSGLLADLSPFGLTSEPRVPDAVADGRRPRHLLRRQAPRRTTGGVPGRAGGRCWRAAAPIHSPARRAPTR